MNTVVGPASETDFRGSEPLKAQLYVEQVHPAILCITTFSDAHCSKTRAAGEFQNPHEYFPGDVFMRCLPDV